jgi:hypothetical protein
MSKSGGAGFAGAGAGMSRQHPCLEPPPHLKRVERPEDVVRVPTLVERLRRAFARFR